MHMHLHNHLHNHPPPTPLEVKWLAPYVFPVNKLVYILNKVSMYVCMYVCKSISNE